MPASEFSHREITSYEEDKRYEEFRSKRALPRNLGKAAVCLCSVSTCATIVWLVLYMRSAIFAFHEMASRPLDHDQAVDEAAFGYFGPQLENLWRAFLIANLGLTFLASLYIPLGVFFEHYYPLTFYSGLMFAEAVLSCGNQYMAVAYYAATAIFATTGVAVHVFVHYLRLDMLEEVIFWREHDEEEMERQRQEMMMLQEEERDIERSDSFEMSTMGGKNAHR